MPLQRQRLEGHSCKPGTPMVAESHQELEEARKDSSLEPLEGARPSRPFDLGLVVSGIVLRHLVCAHLYGCPGTLKQSPSVSRHNPSPELHTCISACLPDNSSLSRSVAPPELLIGGCAAGCPGQSPAATGPLLALHLTSSDSSSPVHSTPRVFRGDQRDVTKRNPGDLMILGLQNKTQL